MNIYKLPPLSVCETNSYIVAANSKNAVLVDAPFNADFIYNEIEKRGLKLCTIILTHGHFDHIGAAAGLVEKTGCKVYVHEEDLVMLTNNRANMSVFFDKNGVPIVNGGIPYRDGDTIKLDELEFKVIHTPGHTAGSSCLAINDVIFTGDTLFCGSVGRTDFPGSSAEKMQNSLEKLRSLDGDYTIMAGHGEDTTLDYERRTNVYMRGQEIY